MRRALVCVLLAWYFLSLNHGRAVNVGPFRSLDECNAMRGWALGKNRATTDSDPSVSWCWWDGKL